MLEYKRKLSKYYYLLWNDNLVLQEGVGKLWRGTNAGLVLAVPTVG